MTKQAYYNASDRIAEETSDDPYLRPAFSLSDRVRRQGWNICWALFYRTSPRPLHSWRAFLLRIFGAELGPNCHFYPQSKVWAPWNLICADQVTAGDGAVIYNPAPITFGSHAILSQEAYVCGATHDYNDPGFPLMAFTMSFGPYAWICARASVAPGVNIGEGAVLGLASVATRNLEPWTVYAGSPAVKVKERLRTPIGAGRQAI
jgi:putative colanic acid biosynthesis acetyltransferase WcaF